MNQVLWFARVMWAFIRRELAALGGYRSAFFIRILGLVLAVASMVFLSRFVGAAVNPHLASYGGNYLGFMVLGPARRRVPAGRRLRPRRSGSGCRR